MCELEQKYSKFHKTRFLYYLFFIKYFSNNSILKFFFFNPKGEYLQYQLKCTIDFRYNTNVYLLLGFLLEDSDMICKRQWQSLMCNIHMPKKRLMRGNRTRISVTTPLMFYKNLHMTRLRKEKLRPYADRSVWRQIRQQTSTWSLWLLLYGSQINLDITFTVARIPPQYGIRWHLFFFIFDKIILPNELSIKPLHYRITNIVVFKKIENNVENC